MNAKITNLGALFQPQISYRIPQFQRPYAWGEQVQWKPLWEDIRNVALHVLGGKTKTHFMGAIVLQQQKSNTGEVTKRLVIDGQQRLTTLQLLIKATEQVLRNQEDTTRADRLRELIVNQESHWDGDIQNETKIYQSNLNDRRAFQEAIRSQYNNKQGQPWAISQAYRYLKVLAENWLDSSPESRLARAKALEEVLTEHLQIAVIDLDEEEKPHVIFETLNARGEPLKQSDLIKNTVMYEANVVDDGERAEKLWGLFDQQWWRQETKEGRLKRIHIDRFLNYWMVMWTLKDVTSNRVASEFRNYLELRKPSIDTVASEIRESGTFYMYLEGAFRGNLYERETFAEVFVTRMKALELGVVTPLLLWLFKSNVLKEQQKRCIEILESYAVRRKLCGLPTHSLTKVFIALLQKLDSNGPDYADSTVLHFLRCQDADGSVWPNDRMLSEYLAHNPMKGAVPWKKTVLEAIETNLRSDRTEELGSTRNLTIEHIMPESWEAHWPLPSNIADNVEAEEIRNEVVRRIGNLTLTTEKLNKSLSNGPWKEKRYTLANHSTLFLNKTLLENAPGAWDEAAIERRSRSLANRIKEIWPSADMFAESPTLTLDG